MIVQVDLLDLTAVALALFGVIMTAIISIGAILINQLDKNLDFRFALIDKQRAEGQQQAAENMRIFAERQERELISFRNLERDFNSFKAVLPSFAKREELKKAIDHIEKSLNEIRALIVNRSHGETGVGHD